jgi:hypothetical protein
MWFWRFWHWVICVTGYYTTWSKVYRWIHHRAYRTLAMLARGLTMEQAQAVMNKVKYRPDGWRALGDAIGDPARFLYFADNPEEAATVGYDCDCDDYAAFGARVIGDVDPGRLDLVRKALRRSFYRSSVDRDPAYRYFTMAFMLSVAWRPVGEFKPEGHVVCLVMRLTVPTNEVQFAHCGNWKMRGPFKTLRGAAESIRPDYMDTPADLNENLVGWMLMSTGPKMLFHGRSFDQLPDLKKELL